MSQSSWILEWSLSSFSIWKLVSISLTPKRFNHMHSSPPPNKLSCFSLLWRRLHPVVMAGYHPSCEPPSQRSMSIEQDQAQCLPCTHSGINVLLNENVCSVRPCVGPWKNSDNMGFRHLFILIVISVSSLVSTWLIYPLIPSIGFCRKEPTHLRNPRKETID